MFDATRPYRAMGDRPPGQADCVEQDGKVYWWSESNLSYELAWWLYVEDDSLLTQRLKRERPLPPGEVMPRELT